MCGESVCGESVCGEREGGRRERARKRARERESVWVERECVWRERSGQTKKRCQYSHESNQAKESWYRLVCVVVVVGVEFSRNCKSPVCEVMNSYDRDNC